MKHSTKTADGHLQKELPDTIYLQLHGDNEYVGNNEEIDFGALIDKVSGKGAWESNPYVFVYEFELVD